MASPPSPTPAIGVLGFASPLDAIALILFILYSVRRLELGRTTAADYPSVSPKSFEAWKRDRLRLHLWASVACSLKPLLGTFLPYLEYRLDAPARVVRATGAIADLTFIAVLLFVVYKGYQSTKHGIEVGISESARQRPQA